ncbi:MAG: L-fucose isomerase, partial [Oscillospiraceae bacterium]|nr:L-fucose isomerase [Oscillospiraceae bacterium]
RVSGIEASGAAAGGVIHLTNSGAAAVDGAGMQECGGVPAMKPFWDITPEEAALCLENCKWRPANRDYFRGGGYSSNFLTRGGMPLTMSRVNLIKGLGPVLQLAEGHSADLPAKAHEAMNERTDPTWPTTWFVPNLTGGGAFRDVYSVMANWGANHGVLSHGHIGRELIALCALLRIPVSMHNVPAERVCRPAMWPSFGTSEPEGADYRAYKALGPLYG